ncbi:MAG: YbjN domain-containing protein [Bifidobacteriaceae bacterium]|nr:YbjN domain-containing protein [Bifidobacteriaceae bacterium]
MVPFIGEGGFDGSPPERRESPGSYPAPLTRDRIEAALTAEDWSYQIDSDGDIGGLWQSNIFYFFLYGDQHEILQVRGRWHQDLPINLRSSVRDLIDTWHFEKIWPKAYTTVDDSGRLWVLAEHAVDWENGVTDDQLRLTLRCSITTTLSLFRRLQERFVHIAAPPEDVTDSWQ